MTPPAVILRDVTDADFGVIRELRGDFELQHQLMAHPAERTRTDAEDWVRRRTGQGRLWMIVGPNGGQAIGFVQVSRQHFIDLYAYFGIAVARREAGKGIGRSAMTSFIGIARHELKLHKLLLEVRVDNGPARALYSGLGFRTVGSLQEHYFDGSRRHDALVMELLLHAGELA